MPEHLTPRRATGPATSPVAGWVVAAAAGLGLAAPGGASAGPAVVFEFDNVADSTGRLDHLGVPSISDRQRNTAGGGGLVTFFAIRDDGSSGVFVSTTRLPDRRMGPVPLNLFATVADTNGPYASFSGRPGIDNQRRVVFAANLDRLPGESAVEGIFTRVAGSSKLPATTVTSDIDDNFNLQNLDAVINGAGTIAVIRETLFEQQGVFTATAPYTSLNPVPFAETGGFISSLLGIPAVNDRDEVAFRARIASGDERIYVSDGGAPGDVFVADTPGPFKGFGDEFGPAMSINSSGVVAFFAALDDGSSGVFTGTAGGGLPTAVARSGGQYRGFGDVAINDRGTVAFLADLPSGGSAIFADIPRSDGADGGPQRVIGTGDALFGSRVTTVEFFNGLNEHDDIAFRYVLRDGRQGIAMAVVPLPPAAWAGAATLGGLLAARLVRRRLSRATAVA